eukprot:3434596-Rhodomonas_salina.1
MPFLASRQDSTMKREGGVLSVGAFAGVEKYRYFGLALFSAAGVLVAMRSAAAAAVRGAES